MVTVHTEHDRFEVCVRQVDDKLLRLGRWLALGGFALELLVFAGLRELAFVGLSLLACGVGIEGYGGGYTTVRIDGSGITITDRLTQTRIDWRALRSVSRDTLGVVVMTDNSRLRIGVDWPKRAVDALWGMLSSAHAALPALPEYLPPESLRELIRSGQQGKR